MENNDHEDLKVVDTTNILTLEELKELKKLATVSKTTRLVLGIIFAIVSMTGAQFIFEWLSTFHQNIK